MARAKKSALATGWGVGLTPAPRRGLAMLALALLLALAAGIAIAASIDTGPSRSCTASLAVARDLIARRLFPQAEAMLRGFSGADAETLRALLLIETGRWSEARDRLAKVIRSSPDHFEAVRLMAEGCRDQGDVDLAIHWFTRLAKLDEKDPRPWREIARLAQRKGDGMLALQAAQQALALNPKDSEMAAMLGQCSPAEARAARPGAMAPALASGSTLPRPQDYLPQLPKAPKVDSSHPDPGTDPLRTPRRNP